MKINVMGEGEEARKGWRGEGWRYKGNNFLLNLISFFHFKMSNSLTQGIKFANNLNVRQKLSGGW
jgi:hypothetical protein